MKEWIMEHGIETLSFVFALISFGYSLYAKSKSEKAESEISQIKANLEASKQYGKVKELERPFEDALADLVVVINSEEKDVTKIRVFLHLSNKFTNLYNEINSFCALINNGTLVADDYLKNTAVPVIIKYAEKQPECYEILNNAAKKLNQKKLPRPDYNAFQEYDTFLKEKMPKKKYEELQVKRKEAGLIF